MDFVARIAARLRRSRWLLWGDLGGVAPFGEICTETFSTQDPGNCTTDDHWCPSSGIKRARAKHDVDFGRDISYYVLLVSVIRDSDKRVHWLLHVEEIMPRRNVCVATTVCSTTVPAKRPRRRLDIIKGFGNAQKVKRDDGWTTRFLTILRRYFPAVRRDLPGFCPSQPAPVYPRSSFLGCFSRRKTRKKTARQSWAHNPR